jgi:hypothetical protein
MDSAVVQCLSTKMFYHYFVHVICKLNCFFVPNKCSFFHNQFYGHLVDIDHQVLVTQAQHLIFLMQNWALILQIEFLQSTLS